MIGFNAAKIVLNGAERHELRDHAFGDREIIWTSGDRTVASGYAGSYSYVTLYGDGTDENTGYREVLGKFEGDQARELFACGRLADLHRNDETGPDSYNGS